MTLLTASSFHLQYYNRPRIPHTPSIPLHCLESPRLLILPRWWTLTRICYECGFILFPIVHFHIFSFRAMMRWQDDKTIRSYKAKNWVVWLAACASDNPARSLQPHHQPLHFPMIIHKLNFLRLSVDKVSKLHLFIHYIALNFDTFQWSSTNLTSLGYLLIR
jgi:hypothetical protein